MIIFLNRKRMINPLHDSKPIELLIMLLKKQGFQGKLVHIHLEKHLATMRIGKELPFRSLMSIYHHHSPAETLRYLGIDKNEKQLIKVDVNL